MLVLIDNMMKKTPEVEETRHKRRHCQSESNCLAAPVFASSSRRCLATGLLRPAFVFLCSRMRASLALLRDLRPLTPDPGSDCSFPLQGLSVNTFLNLSVEAAKNCVFALVCIRPNSALSAGADAAVARFVSLQLAGEARRRRCAA
jgi:hypothetical protein